MKTKKLKMPKAKIEKLAKTAAPSVFKARPARGSTLIPTPKGRKKL